MRRVLLNLIFLFTVFACAPATQDLEEKNRDYIIDDDEKDDDRLEEDQKTGDDSLSNRDMQAIAILRE